MTISKIAFSVICILLITGKGFTQDVVIEGTVSLTNDLVTSIDGNLTNKGTLTNGGELRISGSWMNLGNYTSEGGEVVFASDEDQVINHNDQDFDHFILAGGGNKILMESVTINGTLEFESGKLVVEDGSRIVLGPDVILNGTSEESYIIGEVHRQGVGELFYPIGDETNYLPVTLKNVQGDNPMIGIRTFSEQSEQGVGGSLESISNLRYWELLTDNTYQGSNIVLPIVNEGILADEEEATIAQATSDVAKFYDIGRETVTGSVESGFVESAGLALGRYYVIGKSSTDETLPPIRVINVVTPIQDGKHDFLRIENVELYENNKVEIYNRVGELVFQMENYDNQDRVFRGNGNVINNQELITGNYFYSISLGKNNVTTGYIFLKR